MARLGEDGSLQPQQQKACVSPGAQDFLLSKRISKKTQNQKEKISLTQNESSRKAAVRTAAKSLLIVASAKGGVWIGEEEEEEEGSLPGERSTQLRGAASVTHSNPSYQPVQGNHTHTQARALKDTLA
ncbi:hypothetical protein FQA47_021657 [Oryzias melastigma]|uniref:Uncharacterized protein n=1 Tax=Oryzias melastigma TaxID=30732 RepID=A0A834FMP5_ORYME|nr:hypothetical protein FQA47_021657 [Oryzias melastigma]